MNKALRCSGRREQFRNGKQDLFKCSRKATGIVETQVGFSEHHYICDDDECYRSIAQGYPACFKPFCNEKVRTKS